MPNRAEILKQKFVDSVGLPFSDVLPVTEIESILATEQVTYRHHVFSPVVTLWAFLSQVIAPDKSLRNAVSRVIAWLSALGEAVPSSDTGAYSKARSRLPERVIRQLFDKTAQSIEATVPEGMLWCGRRVLVCDGSSVLMSDTDANQQVYPQHSNQADGCGFPIAKLVVMFSLTTEAVLNALVDPFHTSELVMARQLYQQLTPDDVMLADSAFGTYGDLAMVQAAGADAVFRKHHARKTDFRRGKKLGIGDHIVTWTRPNRRPQAIPPEVFETLPAQLLVREVHLLVTQPGFRPQEIIVVTTLLDARRYPKARLAELYRLRWSAAEVNLRHLKTTLKMDMLLTKTPVMFRKELWMHLIAYNLLRTLMWKAARQAKVAPLRLSLQGARQLFNQFIPQIAMGYRTLRKRLYAQLLIVVAKDLVPLRPDRVEPRAKKRRPKSYPWLQEPRSTFKARMAA